jgi:hypothetical protein
LARVRLHRGDLPHRRPSLLYESLRPAHAVGFACVLTGTWLALRGGPAAPSVALVS